MKTNVIITPDGHVVPDNRALEFAHNHSIDAVVSVGTGVMLDAFRLLRAQGKIEELTVTFFNGEVREIDELGRLNDWPHNDPIVDASCNIACKLINIATEAYKAAKNKS